MAGQITIGNVDIVAVLDMVPPPRDPWMMFPTTAEPDWPITRCFWNAGSCAYYLHFFLRSEANHHGRHRNGPGPHPERGNAQ